MQKIKENYSYTIQWVKKDEDWAGGAEYWDGQWYYEIFYKNKKIGYAAFVVSDNEDYIMFCDFFDLGINIEEEKHKRKGLGSFIINDVQNRTGKKLYFDENKDNTKEGLNFLYKNNIDSI